MKTKKFTALFTLAGIIFSACSPVFADMTEEKLREREKLQTERALMLSDKEINLDDKEQALNRRNADLEELARVLDGRKTDLAFREIELDDLKASLNHDSERLAFESSELERDRQEFAAYKAEVEKKAQEAELLAKETQEKLDLAVGQELINMASIQEIDADRAKLDAGIEQLHKDQRKLLAEQATLTETSRDIQEKIALLAQREKAYSEAIEVFDRDKKALEDKKIALEKEKSDLEAQVKEALAEAKRIKDDAEQKLAKANEIIALNEDQKATIAKLERELADKTKELAELYAPQNFGPLIAMLVSDVSPNSSITAIDNGIINWSDGSIRAKGIGGAPEGTAENFMQPLARRAAIVDLQRNLLETIQGVQIDSNTTVENLMLKSDRVTTAVKGTIRGVEIVSEQWDEKTKVYTVAGQVRQEKLSGVMSEASNYVPVAKKPKEPKKKTESYTGLILDIRHLPVAEQKFFHVVDEKGQLVYGFEYTDKNIRNKDGLCVYYVKILTAEDEKERVGKNPLIIKVQRFASNGTDIVIPTSEAEKIRANKIDFRKECRVIVVRS